MEKRAKPAGSKRTYEWPRPAVTVDVALFTIGFEGGAPELRVLLIERAEEPFLHTWALPGGFVHENEDLPAAAARELQEETGAKDVFLEQVGAVGTPGRDPRGHTVTVLHVALVSAARHVLRPSGDSRAAQWFPVPRLPKLAFDHGELIDLALEHLRRRFDETDACFQLLPEEFTIGELQGVCEAILGRELDKRNFRRRLEEGEFLVEVKGARREGRHRPAQLYRLVPKAFAKFAGKSRVIPFG